MADDGGRFGTYSDEDIQDLLDDKDSKNTKRAIKTSVTVFNEYLRTKHHACIEDMVIAPNEELAQMLTKFYAEV